MPAFDGFQRCQRNHPNDRRDHRASRSATDAAYLAVHGGKIPGTDGPDQLDNLFGKLDRAYPVFVFS